MEPFFTSTGVFGATLLAYIFGALWYSPLLFQKAWLYGNKITKKDIPKRDRMYIFQISLYSFIAHACISSVLAVMFDLLLVNSLKVAVSLGLLLTFSFIVTTRYIDMLYTAEDTHSSKVPQVKFLVQAGYYLVAISIISAALFLFAAR
jgi:hypothetical protein